TLGGLISRVARAMLIDGEAFVQMVVDPVTMQLRLRLLTADQVDAAKTVPGLSMMGGTPLIVSGIEFDATGRRVAFWVIPDPPDASWASVRPSVRVSAMDVCHCFEPRFPGVPRGMSPLSPVAALALELDKSHDAAVAKINVTALMSMIIRDI